MRSSRLAFAAGWLLGCLAAGAVAGSLAGPVAAESLRPAFDEICGAPALSGAEIVAVESKAFLGGEVTVAGLLTLPEAGRGGGGLPGLVLLHTAAGLEPPECYARIRARLRDWGFATLLVDVASGGGQTPKRGYEASIHDWREDLSAAARRLAAEPRVDPRRIGAIGWSRGALALLHQAAAAPRAGASTGGVALRAGVGFYPTCPRRLERLSLPILLVHGDADRMAPIESCRSVTVADGGRGRLAFVELAGARHFFDHPNRPEHDPRIADQAWSRVKAFLDKELEDLR